VNNLQDGKKFIRIGVSILVLMELPREQKPSTLVVGVVTCFNPCFNGIAS